MKIARHVLQNGAKIGKNGTLDLQNGLQRALRGHSGLLGCSEEGSEGLWGSSGELLGDLLGCVWVPVESILETFRLSGETLGAR